MDEYKLILQQLSDITLSLNTLIASIKKTTDFPFQTNFNSSSAIRVEVNGISQYINAQQIIDAAVLDANSVGKNGRVSGNIVHVGGFTYKTVNLVYRLNNILFYSHGFTIVLSDSDPIITNNRIDTIYGDDAGLIDVIESAVGPAPIKPLVETSSQVELTFAEIPGQSTEPSNIDTQTWYLENLQEVGGESDTAENTSAARIDLANTDAPIEGTVSIKTIDDLNTNDEFSLFNSTPVQISTFDFIKLSIQSLRAWGNDHIQVQLFSGVTLINDTIVINKNMINVNDLVTEQEVYLFKQMFGIFGGTAFDKIVFWNKSTNKILYQVDKIYVQIGGETPDPVGITGEDVSLDVSSFGNNLSSADVNAQIAFQTLNDLIISAAPTVTVNGNGFSLRKHPDNSNPSFASTIEDNDIIYSGFWDTTTWWPAAFKKAGDKDLVGSWVPFNPIGSLALI